MASRIADARNMLAGDAFTQRAARAVLPILVRQARGPASITYEDLTREIGELHHRPLGAPLGLIGRCLENLSEATNQEIPPIQALVINKKTRLPGEGIGWFVRKFLSVNYDEMSRTNKKAFLNVVHDQVHEYRHWKRVLSQLGLQAPGDDFSDLVDKAKAAQGTGGEGPEHRKLKEWISTHPEFLGINRNCNAEMERRLPSGDALDVSFRSARSWIAVEVKSSISGDADISRGIFQIIKYKAVMKAECDTENLNMKTDAVLIVEQKVPDDLRALARTVSVRVIEVSKRGSGYFLT